MFQLWIHRIELDDFWMGQCVFHPDNRDAPLLYGVTSVLG